MYQLAAIAFIVAAAGAGAYLAQRPTIGSSAGLADAVHDLSAYKDDPDIQITCDDHVPIGVEGARFHCTARDAKGDEDALTCTLYRTGSLACPSEVVHRAETAPKSGDVWK